MARFDLHRAKNRPGLLLVVQTHYLDHLQTRVAVPLLPLAKAPPGVRDLNPEFNIAGDVYRLFPQFISAVPRRELGVTVGNLSSEHDVIIRALDLLLTGF